MDENQALWFRQSKAIEELFDTENDPHELNNIANDPAYAEVLATLRAECERWMKDIDDKGRIPEIDLITDFYPNGKAKLTDAPKLKINNGKVSVYCDTPGVRIGYRYASEKNPYNGWKHYTDPIEEIQDDTLEIITHRLGFKYGITTVFNGVRGKTFFPPNWHDNQKKVKKLLNKY